MAFIHHQLVILVNNCALPASWIPILLSFVVCVVSNVPARLALKHVYAAEIFRMALLIVLGWRGKDKLHLWGRKQIKYLQFCGAVQVPEAQAIQEHRQHFWAVLLPVWELDYIERKKGQLYFSPVEKVFDWKVSRKKVSAGKSPLLSSSMSARCLSCAGIDLQPLGSWEIWQRQRCPLTVGETGSNKANKSLPRRHFWPQCRCTSSWGRVSFPFVCWADSSYNCGFQPGSSQTWQKCRDVPAMPERGHKLLMALSSQRKQSFGETVSRKSMCRSDKVTRLVLFVACVSVIFSRWGREQTAIKSRIQYLG